MWIRRLIIRLMLPLIWGASKRRTAQALAEFSRTEIDSAWQCLYGMRHSKDPELRSKFFQHALEEVHHGALFRNLATKYSENHLSVPIAERIALYDIEKKDQAEVEFFAIGYLGESNICKEFNSYANAAPQEDIKNLFTHLQEDEKGHVIYTKKELDRLTNHNSVTRSWMLTKAIAHRLYRAWVDFGNSIGHFIPGIIIGAIYFIYGPIGRKLCQRRLNDSYQFENESLIAKSEINKKQMKRVS